MSKSIAELAVPPAHEVIEYLDRRMQTLLSAIEGTQVWQDLTSPSTDAALVRSIMREVYFEIHSYQRHVIEAAIATIGQMPRDVNPRLIRAMLCHQAGEFDHGEMALKDYIALGGDEHRARGSRMSPASFAVSAVWWMIARIGDPFAYLGALYPFEGLTPIVTSRVKPHLLAKGLPQASLAFIEFHSTEDVKHTQLVQTIIKEIAGKFPTSVDSIKHGLDCFLAVYPLPVWNTAYGRAKATFKTSDEHA